MTRPAACPALPLWEAGSAALFAAAGLALSLWLFFPGMATHDTLAVYDQAHAWVFGDWQPPLLGVLWIWFERVFGYGPRAMFVPTVAVYWGALLLVFLALRRAGARSAWLALVVGIMPATFVLIGIVWRDVIFSVCWLFAVALTLTAAEGSKLARAAAGTAALLVFLVGAWLRPNALFAAPPLLAYVLWPREWRWKPLILMAVPAMIALEASAYAINFGWLGAKRDNALHSVFVYDLTGITHFTGQNAFPVPEWTPQQVSTIATVCYDPNYWDAIWWADCSFAMQRLDRDDPPGTKLFGSATLRGAWLQALLAHPLAYVRHRLTFFKALMTNPTMVLFDQVRSRQWRFFIVKDASYRRFESTVAWLHEHTPLFRGLPWLLLALVAGASALRLPNGRAKAAAMALSLSGFIYALSYLVFGVAAEYRYVYWTALSSLTAMVVVLARWEIGRREHRLACSRRLSVL